MAPVQVTIDGKTAGIAAGTTILEAAKQMGIEIPHFCYHPGLRTVGVCRMCLVQVKGAPKLVIACNTPVAEGIVVETKTPEVLAAQKGMIEFLLLDHPLDCPICDKGGECPLQNFAHKFGAGESRFDMAKQTTYKRRPLGPHIVFDEERCILCWRCTRYSADITGYNELALTRRGSRTQIDLMHGDSLEDPFQGNLADICPVGALTSREFRFQARAWEMRHARTSCSLCAAGCSIEAWSRKGELLRITAAENLAVNDYWICDRGRYGHAFANSPGRVTEPLVRRVGDLVPATWKEALDAAAKELGECGPVALLAGAELTNEDYFALQRLARETLATEDLDLTEPAPDAGLMREHFASGPVWGSVPELETAGAIVVVGEDIERTHPIYFLRLRKAIRRGVPVVFLGSERSKLEEFATVSELVEPSELASRLALLASALSAGVKVSVGANASALGEAVAGRAPIAVILNAPSRAAELLPAARELCGSGRSGAGAKAGTHPADNAGARSGILLLPRGANAQGARDAGFAPGFLPGYRPAENRGRGFDAIVKASAAGEIGTLLLVQIDKPAAGGEGAAAPVKLDLGRARRVVFASFLGPACDGADVVLPALTALEAAGTRTTADRRVLRMNRTMAAPGSSQAVWSLAQALSNVMGRSWNYKSETDVFGAIRGASASYQAIEEIGPGGTAWDITSLRNA